MKKLFFTLLGIVGFVGAKAQQAPSTSGSKQATAVFRLKQLSLAQLNKAASKINKSQQTATNNIAQQAPSAYGALPTAGQLNWHQMEMYCIIHFGVDTYTDKEWGFGDENPALVNPKSFDASQIVGAAKAGGFNGVVVVAKHHDGLCIWPTQTTEHNISKSPWRGGKGDMVKEYQEACAKLGMQLGLYCSPWDRNSAWYGTAAYVDIYRAQLKELYSNYGKLFISWHDGANGGDGYYGGKREIRKIDRTTYYGWPTTWAIPRKLQPNATIFGDVGPDVRWVGNEEGHAGETSWATYTPEAPDSGQIPANGYVKSDLGVEGTRNGKFWMPAECDVSLRPGWFYHASQNAQVKSPATLMDLYYKSVGRGANLDLGLSPNRDGVLDPEDVAALKGFGDLLRNTFATNLAKGATLEASNIRGGNSVKFGPALLMDADRYSYWATDDAVTTPTLTLNLKGVQRFNVICLRENIKLGQRIEAVEVEAFINNQWKKIASATSIGSNRLIRLPQAITASRVRLKISKSPVCIALSDFGLYKEPDNLIEEMAKRDSSGRIQMPATNTQSVEVIKSKWTILPNATGQNLASDQQGYAMDNNVNTFWTTLHADKTKTFQPASITIDLHQAIAISSFSYLPRQDKKVEGIVDLYSFSVSEDGINFKEVASGEFSNIRANPIVQVITLQSPVRAHYIRFTGKRSIEGNGITLAELGINSIGPIPNQAK
jgi:alpha-L-fucosidase